MSSRNRLDVVMQTEFDLCEVRRNGVEVNIVRLSFLYDLLHQQCFVPCVILNKRTVLNLMLNVKEGSVFLSAEHYRTKLDERVTAVPQRSLGLLGRWGRLRVDMQLMQRAHSPAIVRR